LWVIIGLVHDVDYEEHPDEHLRYAPEILRSHGWPEEFIRAIASHGWGLFTDVAPVTDLEKALFAIDELTGLVAAAALVRPSRSILDLPVKSVLKKWKDKTFAAGVDRKVIEKGMALMEVPLEELIADTIEGMKTIAETIGLKGNPSGA
jgi:predicted hydrolase (HD superfamily)